MKRLCGIALFLLAPAFADQVGGIRYQAPPGWTAREVGTDQRLFSAPGLPPGQFASIVLVLGGSFQGGLQPQFQAALATTLNGKRTVQASPVTSNRTPQGYEVVGQMVTAEDRGQPVYAQFAGVNVGGRLLFAGLLASSAEVQRRYQNTIAEFIRAIELPSTNLAPTAVPAAPAPPPGIGTPTPGRPKPGVVAGNIYDQHGRPLRIPGARVEVHIWGAGANGDRNGFTIAADANGHYESRVPHGLYGFHARAYLPLNGSTVCIDLEPLDGQPTHIAVDTTPGVVKDFALKLTGPVAGGDPRTIQGYYGGSITVTDGANWKNAYFGAMSRKYPPGTKVIVALQPLGPAIDGSAVQPLRFECNLEKMQSGEHKAGIPLAAYRASAVLVTPDGRQQPLKIAKLPNVVYGNSVELLYPPDRDDHDGRPEKPNLLVLD